MIFQNIIAAFTTLSMVLIFASANAQDADTTDYVRLSKQLEIENQMALQQLQMMNDAADMILLKLEQRELMKPQEDAMIKEDEQ
jgi:translation elongation factor EF-Tu-like GTPase